MIRVSCVPSMTPSALLTGFIFLWRRRASWLGRSIHSVALCSFITHKMFLWDVRQLFGWTQFFFETQLSHSPVRLSFRFVWCHLSGPKRKWQTQSLKQQAAETRQHFGDEWIDLNHESILQFWCLFSEPDFSHVLQTETLSRSCWTNNGKWQVDL